MLKTNSFKKTKNSKTPFQSDIVIDENGEIHISFFGPELLHLINKKIEPNCDLTWQLPQLNIEHQEELTKVIKQEYESCLLCPKECGFNRIKNVHPNCGDWNLKVSNYGISFGDEHLISNGGGSGVLFLNGCPLTCPSCINVEKVRENTNSTTIHEFLKMCENLYQKGTNNIQILSPSVSLPHIRTCLKMLKDLNFPLPIILKSSGHESLSELIKLDGLVDIYIPDYKFSKNIFWENTSGAENYHNVFLQCLQEMYRQTGQAVFNERNIMTKGVLVRHVLNPYINDIEKGEIDSFLKSLHSGIQISILDNFVVLE